MTRTIRRRSGEAEVGGSEADRGTAASFSGGRSPRAVGWLLSARRRARGRGAQAKPPRGGQARAARGPLREGRPADQPARHGRADPGTGWSSLSDPDARPIRKGKLGKPKRVRLCDPARRGDREHPPWSTRADPPGSLRPRANPGEKHAAARHRHRNSERLGALPRERSLSDGGFHTEPTNETLEHSHPRARVHLRPPSSQAPNAPRDASSATGPDPKGASATSNAATDSTAAGSKATRASRSGPAGAILAYQPRHARHPERLKH